jgi:quercetin dioxygenase-like cupin family protein
MTALATVGTMRLAHQDERRSIYEYGGEGFSIQRFVVHQRVPFGNHFHRRKTETFFIVKGGGDLYMQPADLLTNRGNKWSLVAGEFAVIPPFTAHAFMLEPGSEMICHSSEPFDPSDPDMHQCKII